MKKFLLLTKILIKSGIGNNLYEDNAKKKKFAGLKKTLIYILIGLCFVPMLIALGYMGYGGYKMFEGINTGIILEFACTAGVFLAFFSSITMCIGIFYNSRDIEFILPLPFKAEQIVCAKFVTMYFYTALINILMIIPVFIGYGIAGGLGISYWIIMLLAVIMIPITPLVYGSVFSMVIIRVFKKARNKDVLTVITTVFAIVLVVAINAVINSMESISDQELISMITDKGTSIMKILNSVFPNTALVGNALTMENWAMMLLYILTAVIFVVLFILIAKAVYLSSVVEMSSSTSKNKKLSGEDIKKLGKRNSQLRAYVVKEFKSVLRSPIYFLNCVLLSIAWPIIILIPIFLSVFSGNSNNGVEDVPEVVGQFLKVPNNLVAGICMIVVFGMTVFSVSMSMLNTTCISREGKNVFFMKYIPMSIEKQLQGKLLPGIILNFITGTLYSIIAMIGVVLVFDISIPPVAIVLSVLISILTVVLFNLIEIISDIIKPKLNWESEQAAVKQNFIAIIPMFLTMILGGLLGVGGVLLYINVEISIYLLGIIAIILLALFSFVFYKLDFKLAQKYFPKY